MKKHDYELSLDAYIKEKIRMLRRDFCIKLTKEEKSHFNSLTSEIQADNYAHSIIMKRL